MNTIHPSRRRCLGAPVQELYGRMRRRAMIILQTPTKKVPHHHPHPPDRVERILRYVGVI